MTFRLSETQILKSSKLVLSWIHGYVQLLLCLGLLFCLENEHEDEYMYEEVKDEDENDDGCEDDTNSENEDVGNMKMNMT